MPTFHFRTFLLSHVYDPITESQRFVAGPRSPVGPQPRLGDFPASHHCREKCVTRFPRSSPPRSKPRCASSSSQLITLPSASPHAVCLRAISLALGSVAQARLRLPLFHLPTFTPSNLSTFPRPMPFAPRPSNDRSRLHSSLGFDRHRMHRSHVGEIIFHRAHAKGVMTIAEGIDRTGMHVADHDTIRTDTRRRITEGIDGH